MDHVYGPYGFLFMYALRQGDTNMTHSTPQMPRFAVSRRISVLLHI